MLELEKQNGVLIEQIKHQEVEKEKLKKAMFEFEVFKLASVGVQTNVIPIKL
jgi:hypothetical protein